MLKRSGNPSKDKVKKIKEILREIVRTLHASNISYIERYILSINY
jgi:hypothetical protein